MVHREKSPYKTEPMVSLTEQARQTINLESAARLGDVATTRNLLDAGVTVGYVRAKGTGDVIPVQKPWPAGRRFTEMGFARITAARNSETPGGSRVVNGILGSTDLVVAGLMAIGRIVFPARRVLH